MTGSVSRAAPKRVLIVSPAFPPMSTPDSQRVRMSLAHYRQHGWEPLVLTVDASHQDGAREAALLETVPGDVAIHRTGALPRSLARLFGLGNLGLRAWFHLLLGGAALLRREKIDLVFFSTTQFITFPLGRIWQRWFGVPYVIDLQDPWRTDYYERPGVRRPPGGWKYQFARLQARLLEEWSFRKVSAFMSVSAEYLIELRRRYAWFSAVPSEAIRFGASETDLTAARSLPPPSLPPAPADAVRFVYTGAAGPVTPHAVTLLFRAFGAFRAQEPALAARLRFEFLGTSYAPAERAEPSIMPLAAAAGVDDQVFELPYRLGHLECLRAQAEADVLLLLGSSDLAYSPSKLYPYFLSGRPIVSLVFRNSYLESILGELKGSRMILATDDASSDEALVELGSVFRAAAERQWHELTPTRDQAHVRAACSAEALTARQVRLFDAAIARSSPDARV